MLQLFTARRFYATGNYQKTNGDLIGMLQSTVSRIAHRVMKSIAKRKRHFIIFSTGQSLTTETLDFYKVAGFPNVTGAIGGSRVPIVSPGGKNAEIFCNRKGFSLLTFKQLVIQISALPILSVGGRGLHTEQNRFYFVAKRHININYVSFFTFCNCSNRQLRRNQWFSSQATAQIQILCMVKLAIV